MFKPNNKKPRSKKKNNSTAKHYRKIEPIITSKRKRDDDDTSSDDNEIIIPPPKKLKTHNDDIEEDKSTDILSKKTQLNLINIIIDKFIKNIQTYNNNDDDDDDDDDEDDDYEENYEDASTDLPKSKYLPGLKKEIIYNLEEVEWINKLTDKQKTELTDLENSLIDLSNDEMPIRFRILHSPNINDKTKLIIIQQLDQAKNRSHFSEEYYKLDNWISLMKKIPFDNTIQPIVTNNSSILDIESYLKNAKTILDNEVYGHDNAKHQIISILAREVSNPNSIGNVFAIQGPMGNGKTTLVKHGICKAMNRPFGFIPLGGMQDSSFLVGHEYTYVGSKPGRIVEILLESGCMNPVFYFDELDKVSDTTKGDEIMNVLCHLTDTTQNHAFQDKYFAGIDFNLSQATFIFSYNDESKINPILLDRMNKINTKGFDTKAKTTIAKQYLLPKIVKEFNFSIKDIIINDDILTNIISNYTYNEAGVRNLKRCLEEIVSNCNILRYDIRGDLLNKKKLYTFPITIDNDNLHDFLNKPKDDLAEHLAYSMYL